MDDETDELVLALQSSDQGQALSVVAIALALIDAGLIDRERLLKIIDSLHAILAADFVGALGEIADAEVPLNILREWLDDSGWRAGQVLDRLQTIEKQEFLRSQQRLANSSPKQPRPPKKKE